MTRDSQLSQSQSLPAPIQKVSKNLQRWGFWSFWLQLILGIISTVTLLFATPALFEGEENIAGVQFGILSAFISIVLLVICIIFAWRFGKIGRQIENREPNMRPRKSETMKLLKTAIILNLVGMLFSVIGAQTLVGLALAKLLSVGFIPFGSGQEYVNSLDLLIIQGNTNTIAAHLAGIVTGLILLTQIND